MHQEETPAPLPSMPRGACRKGGAGRQEKSSSLAEGLLVHVTTNSFLQMRNDNNDALLQRK